MSKRESFLERFMSFVDYIYYRTGNFAIRWREPDDKARTGWAVVSSILEFIILAFIYFPIEWCFDIIDRYGMNITKIGIVIVGAFCATITFKRYARESCYLRVEKKFKKEPPKSVWFNIMTTVLVIMVFAINALSGYLFISHSSPIAR